MGTGNPVIWYYDTALLVSLLLTGIYMFRWHKHFDTHITLVYALVPVINLGYSLMAHSTGLEELIAADKFTFIAGCFLELNMLLVVCSLCEVRISRFLKVLLYVFSSAVFLSAMTIGKGTGFYEKVGMDTLYGLPQLDKQYGWMHSVFIAMVLLYYVLSLCVILYSLVRKNQISRKILVLLILPEIFATIAFFAGRRWIRGIELIPAAFVIAQAVYLVIASRISLYDVEDTAVDSLAQNGETGFIAIDFGNHYLGSNEAAREIFPAINNLTVDLSVKRSRSFAELILPKLERYREDNTKKQSNYEKDGRFYMISVAPLISGKREKGYQLTVTDNTRDQAYIRMIQEYNDNLNRQVEEKTAHIVEMHDRLIMSMATMVESRDNSTGGHIRRTSEGVRILLDEMKKDQETEMTESFRKKLIKAAPMHDLGKIAVDDRILRKPGRFEPDEYEQMKAHAAEGARIVHEILKDTDDDEFHLIAENVAHYHHERWDGSGYPEGLKGGEIPREARIMAIADVYDALVSKRVYKDRMSFEKADEIMMGGMGTQFDPALEEIYVRARPRLEEYYSGLEKKETEGKTAPGGE